MPSFELKFSSYAPCPGSYRPYSLDLNPHTRLTLNISSAHHTHHITYSLGRSHHDHIAPHEPNNQTRPC
jgi:hypothetical protein